jgi:hypothetical protein
VSKAKTETLDEKLATSLRHVLGGQPLPLQSAGKSPGIFPSGATGKPVADEALNRGLVEQVQATPPAKGKKPRPLFAITALGQQFVLDRDSPKEALEGIQVALRELTTQFVNNQPSGDRTDLLQGLNTLLDRHFQEIQLAVKTVVAEAGKAERLQARRVEDVHRVIQLVEKAVEGLAKQPPLRPVPVMPRSDDTWTHEVEPYLHARRENRTPGDCPIPELFDALKKRHATLTVGSFHDGLRRLHDANQIRLGGWSGPLENLPQPNLAMLVAHKVMYYARLP